jgi:hypothetical protein
MVMAARIGLAMIMPTDPFTLVFRKFGQYQARKAGFHACESLIASYPTGKWAVTEAFLKS